MGAWPVRKKTLLAIIISIAAVSGLSGCARTQEAIDAHNEAAASKVEQYDSFNAQEFIRRGFTDPVMAPRRSISSRTVWTYGLGTCRLTTSIKNGVAGQQTWSRITDATTMLQQSEYAHCKTSVKQNPTRSTRSTTL